MFYYVNGEVAALEPQLVVIDCGGVGYACNTTAYTQSRLKIGSAAKLYTYLSIREDAVDLFGFGTREELSLFKKLIGVGGVGPKAALSILSSSTPERLTLSIMSGDEKALTVAPGVGKKIAQRIILELKDKMEPENPQKITAAEVLTDEPGGIANVYVQVREALVSLGYSPTDAVSLLKGMKLDGVSVEDAIRAALRKTL